MLLKGQLSTQRKVGKEWASLFTAQLSQPDKGLHFKAIGAKGSAEQQGFTEKGRGAGSLPHVVQKPPLSGWHITTEPTSCYSLLHKLETKKWYDGRHSRFCPSKEGSHKQCFSSNAECQAKEREYKKVKEAMSNIAEPQIIGKEWPLRAGGPSEDFEELF